MLPGTHFTYFFVKFLKNLFLGSSKLGGFIFFGSFGLIASIFYLKIYTQIWQTLSGQSKINLTEHKVACYLFFLWPTFVYWSSNLGKDSICSICIPVIIYSIINRKNLVSYFLLAAFGLLAFMVRPYLITAFGTSAAIATVLTKNRKSGSNWLIGAISIAVLVLTASALKGFTNMDTINIQTISARASFQLTQQSRGTHFYMPTTNSIYVLLLLPYSMACNLLLPIFFIKASGFNSLLASLENTVLFAYLFYALKSRAKFIQFIRSTWILTFLSVYFIEGMALLGMTNTNLGHASREKLMFLPSLMVIILSYYRYKYFLKHRKRSLLLQNSQNMEMLHAQKTT